MHKIVLVALIIFVSQKSFTQQTMQSDTISKTDTTPKRFEERDIVFNKAEKDPEFPGGPKAWVDYLRKNLNTKVAANNGAPVGTYTVIIRFIVNKDGRLRDFTAETGYGFGMEAEVIRILKESPSWNPAMQNGYQVSFYMRQPITFVVVSETK